MQRKEMERVFGQIADLAHGQLGGDISAERNWRGLQSLQQRLEQERLSPPRFSLGALVEGWRLWWEGRQGLALAGAAALVLVAGVAGVATWRAGGRLSYTVERATQGGRPTLARTDGPLWRFSDGTEVALEGAARGRVASVDRRGARVVLEDGGAHVRVAHRPKARWQFEAGPYEVTVTGTAFGLSWSRSGRRLELGLESGSVIVKGPMAGEGVPLRAGQRMIALLNERSLRVEALSAGPSGSRPAVPAGAPTGSDAPALEADTSPGEAPPAARHPTGTAAAPTWARLIAAGDYRTVLKEAQRRGLERTLARAPSADLAALADAARYQGKNDIARRSLAAQRRRFPGTPRAAEAAFLLGRLAMDAPDGRGGLRSDASSALRWLDIYLKEANQGPYAAEALGRKMVVLEKAGRRALACRTAREYLRRQSGGPYAELANSLCAAAR